jgi:hypothetical protein
MHSPVCAHGDWHRPSLRHVRAASRVDCAGVQLHTCEIVSSYVRTLCLSTFNQTLCACGADQPPRRSHRTPHAGHVHVLHVRGKPRVGMELTIELAIEGMAWQTRTTRTPTRNNSHTHSQQVAHPLATTRTPTRNNSHTHSQQLAHPLATTRTPTRTVMHACPRACMLASHI